MFFRSDGELTSNKLGILTLLSIYLILSAALGPGVHSASNRMSTTRSRKIMFLWVERRR
jgi:hypothetical protein